MSKGGISYYPPSPDVPRPEVYGRRGRYYRPTPASVRRLVKLVNTCVRADVIVGRDHWTVFLERER